MRPERDGPIAGVILAAGTSSRMGRNKLFLELDGETAIRRCVTRAMSALDMVIVVLGMDAERVRHELAGLRYTPVMNDDSDRGINHSVRLGIEAVPETAVAAVVLLADMPFVTSDMIATLVRRYRSRAAPLVISRYGDVHAPPMLHDRSLFPEFFAADGEGAGQRIVKRHLDEAELVDWPRAALADIDVPDDYARACERLHAR